MSIKKVFVYRNLRTGTWSVKYNGRVIYHSSILYIKNPQFKVSIKGRNRVLSTKQKNVHAGVYGELQLHFSGNEPAEIFGTFPDGYIGYLNSLLSDKIAIKNIVYNPYKYESFVDKKTEKPPTKLYTKRGQNIFNMDWAIMDISAKNPVVGLTSVESLV